MGIPSRVYNQPARPTQPRSICGMESSTHQSTVMPWS